LKGIIYGFQISQCIYCAAVLGIADHLYGSPKTSEELAEITLTDSFALQRLLRSLTHHGIFKEDETGRFGLTPLAELLRTDADGSLRTEIIHMLHPSSWKPWGELLQSVRTGKAAFPGIFGTDVWNYRAQNPEIGAIFDDMAMVMSKAEAEELLGHLDLTNCKEIIDVGGGKGGLIAAILSCRTNLRGVLLDQPHVLAGAEELLREAGVANRCRVEPGDFFSTIPRCGDIYLLKSILHNWNDEAAVTILKNCRQAMTSNARIVLVESLVDPAKPSPDCIDIHMLVIHGGKQRTSVEFEALFDTSGFRLQNIVNMASAASLIVGVPA
jgi:hypothetical protein